VTFRITLPAAETESITPVAPPDGWLNRVAKPGGSIIGPTKTRNNWFYGASNWGRMAADGDFLGRAG